MQEDFTPRSPVHSRPGVSSTRSWRMRLYPGWVPLAPVPHVVVAHAVEIGKPASLDGRVQNPLDPRMPVDRRLQVALVITEVSLVENQMRPFPPDQLQYPVGPRTVARVSDEGHLEIRRRNHQAPLRVLLRRDRFTAGELEPQWKQSEQQYPDEPRSRCEPWT